jgi:hypothetical protein
MRAYWKLTQAQLVLFARNRTVIFFFARFSDFAHDGTRYVSWWWGRRTA